MKKLFLIVSMVALSLFSTSCSKSPESQAESCMKALMKADFESINKLFLPEMASMLGMARGEIEASAKEDWSIESVKPVEGQIPSGAKFAFTVSYKKGSDGSSKEDKIYLIEQDGVLYCALRK